MGTRGTRLRITCISDSCNPQLQTVCDMSNRTLADAETHPEFHTYPIKILKDNINRPLFLKTLNTTKENLEILPI